MDEGFDLFFDGDFLFFEVGGDVFGRVFDGPVGGEVEGVEFDLVFKAYHADGGGEEAFLAHRHFVDVVFCEFEHFKAAFKVAGGLECHFKKAGSKFDEDGFADLVVFAAFAVIGHQGDVAAFFGKEFFYKGVQAVVTDDQTGAHGDFKHQFGGVIGA